MLSPHIVRWEKTEGERERERELVKFVIYRLSALKQELNYFDLNSLLRMFCRCQADIRVFSHALLIQRQCSAIAFPLDLSDCLQHDTWTSWETCLLRPFIEERHNKWKHLEHSMLRSLRTETPYFIAWQSMQIFTNITNSSRRFRLMQQILRQVFQEIYEGRELDEIYSLLLLCYEFILTSLWQFNRKRFAKIPSRMKQ